MPTPDASGRFGVYSATVAAVNDPEQRGRVQLRIPSLFGDVVHPPWALPMGQTYGADPEGTAGRLVVPEVGAAVFVMFLDGAVEVPLWMPGAWARGPREIGHDQQHPPLQNAYPTQRLHWRSRMGATLIETSQGDVTYANRRRDLSLKFEQGRLNIDLRPGAKVVVNEPGDDQYVARNKDPVEAGSLSFTFTPGSGATLSITYTPPEGMGAPVVLASGSGTIELKARINGGSPRFLVGD